MPPLSSPPQHHIIHNLESSQRPRERCRHEGPHVLSSAELLAIILGSGARGQSALALGQQLLAQFESLPGLARATLPELQTVHGIGPTKAIEIQAALELGRRLLAASPLDQPQINSPADAANLLMTDMAFLEQEQLRVILLNTRNRVLKTCLVYQGSINTSVVRIAELFRPAIRENAAALIMAHNHPSGDPSPSQEDIRVTREVVRAGVLLNIQVLDHMIIGRNRYVSLKEKGLGF